MVHPAFGQVKAAHRYFDLGKDDALFCAGSRIVEPADVPSPLVRCSQLVLKYPSWETVGDLPPPKILWPVLHGSQDQAAQAGGLVSDDRARDPA
jgi:hypothetical protein